MINTITRKLISPARLIILAVLILLIVLPLPDGLLDNTYKTMISRILIFTVYAMAYDILRGYLGFIHLGFALFIGGGSYFVGILFVQVAVSYPLLLLAIGCTIGYSILWGLLVSKIASRGSSTVALAMITMAFCEIMRNVMERMRAITNGLDGLNYKLPEPLADRTFMYYLSLIFLVVMGFVLYKFISSPTGRVIQSIRENEQRAVFLGYNTNRARTIALMVACISAGLSGIMYGLLNRFVNTDLLSMQMTYNAMLYSLIGGTGTLIGSLVGSTVVIFFQNTLLNLRSVHFIFERWLLFFGALYIVVILFMPDGIMGFINSWKEKREQKLRLPPDAK